VPRLAGGGTDSAPISGSRRASCPLSHTTHTRCEISRRTSRGRPRTSTDCTPGARLYLPGAGWIGYPSDPTSGLRRRGHIPLGLPPEPSLRRRSQPVEESRRVSSAPMSVHSASVSPHTTNPTPKSSGGRRKARHAVDTLPCGPRCAAHSWGRASPRSSRSTIPHGEEVDKPPPSQDETCSGASRSTVLKANTPPRGLAPLGQGNGTRRAATTPTSLVLELLRAHRLLTARDLGTRSCSPRENPLRRRRDKLAETASLAAWQRLGLSAAFFRRYETPFY